MKERDPRTPRGIVRIDVSDQRVIELVDMNARAIRETAHPIVLLPPWLGDPRARESYFTRMRQFLGNVSFVARSERGLYCLEPRLPIHEDYFRVRK